MVISIASASASASAHQPDSVSRRYECPYGEHCYQGCEFCDEYDRESRDDKHHPDMERRVKRRKPRRKAT